MGRHIPIYEPRGRMAIWLEHVKADPARVWTAAEAAEVMGMHSGKIGGTALYAIEAGVLFAMKKDRRIYFSGRPFRDGMPYNRQTRSEPEPPAPIPKWNPEDDPRIPRVIPGWTPPKMVCVRLGA